MTTSTPKQSSEHVSRRSKHKLVYRPLVHYTSQNQDLHALFCMRRLTKDKTGEVIIPASS